MSKSKKSAAVAAPAAPAVNNASLVAAVTVNARKPGRVTGALASVAALLSAPGGASVKAVAQAVGTTERDVRLAIDTLRRKGGYGAVTRLSPGQFYLNPAPKA